MSSNNAESVFVVYGNKNISNVWCPVLSLFFCVQKFCFYNMNRNKIGQKIDAYLNYHIKF